MFCTGLNGDSTASTLKNFPTVGSYNRAPNWLRPVTVEVAAFKNPCPSPHATAAPVRDWPNGSCCRTVNAPLLSTSCAFTVFC